ncbi:hepatoma-derived growth factor-related protein 2-like [Salvia splendens]|uniref:hepatoma-derived growth factor-related protein 2-like n=1 Tax=Salvia splendens TaxID=180675 RepID=UPI001C28119B|nr:hepatoma-derived growth factor-related protein 2-like [Salvia splendens]
MSIVRYASYTLTLANAYAQSRSPSSPQARFPLPSPSRVTPSTPKQASKPHSPSRAGATPPSPKRKQPASPSKALENPTEKFSTSDEAPILASKENDPKPAASQQKAEVKEEIKPDSAVVANVQTQEGTSFKHDDVEEKPSQPSQLDHAVPPAKGPETHEMSKSVDSFVVNDGGDAPDIKLDAKREDVKEVVEATKTDEKKKEVDDSVAPKSTSEAQIVKNAEIPSEEDQIHREKHEAPDVKEILATPGYVTASQPVKIEEHRCICGLILQKEKCQFTYIGATRATPRSKSSSNHRQRGNLQRGKVR